MSLVLLRKPEGVTSFRAIGPVKRRLGISKIGHAGTLDKFASGLLIAMIGAYTRLADYVQAGEKLYRGVARFGEETETLDPEGRVVASAPPPSRECLEAALPRFIGAIMQAPPAFSAIHVGGARAYELALSGRPPEMKARPVTISSLKLLSYDGRDAELELSCSSGTYVRSLARDLALACGSRAHLVALERLSIGPFSLESAVSPEEFDPETDQRPLSREEALALGLGIASLPSKLVPRFRNGSMLEPSDLSGLKPEAESREIAVFEEGAELLGIAFVDSGRLRYRAVLPGGEGLS